MLFLDTLVAAVWIAMPACESEQADIHVPNNFAELLTFPLVSAVDQSFTGIIFHLFSEIS